MVRFLSFHIEIVEETAGLLICKEYLESSRVQCGGLLMTFGYDSEISCLVSEISPNTNIVVNRQYLLLSLIIVLNNATVSV